MPFCHYLLLSLFGFLDIYDNSNCVLIKYVAYVIFVIVYLLLSHLIIAYHITFRKTQHCLH